MSENCSPRAIKYIDPIMQVLVVPKNVPADIKYIHPLSGWILINCNKWNKIKLGQG
jgi:hypothetical protein